jgi:hypothetical protein
MSGLIAQPRGPLDQHHADIIRRAGAEAEPNRHKDFEPITFAFYQREEIGRSETGHVLFLAILILTLVHYHHPHNLLWSLEHFILARRGSARFPGPPGAAVPSQPTALPPVPVSPRSGLAARG